MVFGASEQDQGISVCTTLFSQNKMSRFFIQVIGFNRYSFRQVKCEGDVLVCRLIYNVWTVMVHGQIADYLFYEIA